MSSTVERLVHFQCNECHGWWTIGDAPMDRAYYCPWCGVFQPPTPERKATYTTIASDTTIIKDSGTQ